jgi:hypothetical protein
VTIRSRATDYEPATYEWIYASDAAARAASLGGDGVKRREPLTFEWVVTTEHALKLSQILALRSVHVRNRFRFRLGPRWALLEPGDLVSFTHAKLGISGKLCRIKSFDSRERGLREVTIEEVPVGAAQPVALAAAPHDGFNAATAPMVYVDARAALDLANVEPASVTEALLGDNAVTGPKLSFDALKTSNYAEDGSGNPTAGAKLDHQGTALKVAPGNLVVGAYTFRDTLKTFVCTVSGTATGVSISINEPDTNFHLMACANGNSGSGVPSGAYVVQGLTATRTILTLTTTVAPGAGNSVQFRVLMFRLPW